MSKPARKHFLFKKMVINFPKKMSFMLLLNKISFQIQHIQNLKNYGYSCLFGSKYLSARCILSALFDWQPVTNTLPLFRSIIYFQISIFMYVFLITPFTSFNICRLDVTYYSYFILLLDELIISLFLQFSFVLKLPIHRWRC